MKYKIFTHSQKGLMLRQLKGGLKQTCTKVANEEIEAGGNQCQFYLNFL
jgi:hypothetical protein